MSTSTLTWNEIVAAYHAATILLSPSNLIVAGSLAETRKRLLVNRKKLVLIRRKLIAGIALIKHARKLAKKADEKKAWGKKLKALTAKKTAVNKQLKTLRDKLGMKRPRTVPRVNNPRHRPPARRKKASTLVVADDFQKGEQVRLKVDFSIGTVSSNSAINNESVQDMGTTIPAGTVGSIDRIEEYGTPDEQYVVRFSEGTVYKFPAAQAAEILESMTTKASTSSRVLPLVRDKRHAAAIIDAFCTRFHDTVATKAEVFVDQYEGIKATYVNALVPNLGWRRFAITANLVVDTTVNSGGVVRRCPRNQVDSLGMHV